MLFRSALGFQLWREMGRQPSGYPMFFLKILPATLAGIGAGWGLRGFWPAQEFGTISTIVRVLLLSGVGGGVFLGVSLLLGVAEVREVMAKILGKLRRR